MSVTWLDEEAFTHPGKRLAVPQPEAPAPRAPARAPHNPQPQSAERYTGENKHEVDRMVPIAIELARVAGTYGIIVGEIRAAAARRGIITGYEKDRALSYLGRVPRAAGLVALRGQFRRTQFDVQRTHGNLQQVWVLPEYAPR